MGWVANKLDRALRRNNNYDELKDTTCNEATCPSTCRSIQRRFNQVLSIGSVHNAHGGLGRVEKHEIDIGLFH